MTMLAAVGVSAQVASVVSPDGRLKVNVDVKGGKPVYEVKYDDKQMLDEIFESMGIGKQAESVSCDTCIYNGDCERQRRLKEKADTYCVHWMQCKEEDR